MLPEKLRGIYQLDLLNKLQRLICGEITIVVRNGDTKPTYDEYDEYAFQSCFNLERGYFSVESIIDLIR